MKIAILTLAWLCGCVAVALSQNANCLRPEVQKGTRLVYKAFSKPAPTYINAAYFKESPKNQQKIKEKFEKENPMVEKVRTIHFDMVKDLGDGQIMARISTSDQGSPISTSTYIICKNDTTAALAANQVNLNDNSINYNWVVEHKNAAGEPIGFTEMGVRIIPPIREVGQTFPDYVVSSTVSSTGQQKLEWDVQRLTKVTQTNTINFTGSGTIHTYTTFENEYTPEKVQAFLEVSTYSEMLYKNRKITAKKDVQVGGQTYTAYCLYEELWTGLPTYQVDSDNRFVKRINERLAKSANKQVVDMLRKSGSTVNEKGYIVTKLESWLIPGLGAYEGFTFEPDGTKVRSAVLTEVKAPE